MLILQLFMFQATSLSAESFTQSEHSHLDLHDLFQQLKVKPAMALSWNNLPIKCLMDSYSDRIIIIWFLAPIPCIHMLIMFLMKICKLLHNSFPSISHVIDLIWTNELSGQKDASFAILT